MTIPNLITVARLFAVPLVVWLMIADRFGLAMILFVLAGISDAVDGFLAKRFGAASELGAYLDPLADKALLVSLFVTLGLKGLLPAWLIVLVVSRDILIVGGVMLAYMLANPVVVKPLWVSKLNTVAQIVLVALVLAKAAGLTALQPAIGPAVLAASALTLVSAGAYVREWLRHMAGGRA